MKSVRLYAPKDEIMTNIKQRITALENKADKKSFRPLPLSYFYGESLPSDFYTNPIYAQTKVLGIVEFYEELLVT